MKIRTVKPANNKFYITTSKGGYNTCIEGSPTDPEANVLSNCVGYASGRFNEIIGTYKYKTLNCNAEKFIERAKEAGLQISDKPSLGGIMVWQKGSTLNGSDGAGHVAIVERIDGNDKILTSESAYGGNAFYNKTRTNANGRWGLGSTFQYRGCIVNPAIGLNTEPACEEVSNYTKGVYITLFNMYVRSGPSTKYSIKRVKDLTADGKASCTSSNPYAFAIYKKGTDFSALEIIENGNEVWARTPSGYVALKIGDIKYSKKA